jgi:hypothetical protein
MKEESYVLKVGDAIDLMVNQGKFLTTKYNKALRVFWDKKEKKIIQSLNGMESEFPSSGLNVLVLPQDYYLTSGGYSILSSLEECFGAKTMRYCQSQFCWVIYDGENAIAKLDEKVFPDLVKDEDSLPVVAVLEDSLLTD